MEPRPGPEIIKKTLTLIFDGKEYEVPVLRRNAAAAWRKEYSDRTREVSASMIVENMDDKGHLSKAVGNALTGALIAFPEKIPELVFSYAPTQTNGEPMPKELILETAFDQEFSLAFAKIWQVAFSPFLDSLGAMMELQKAQASASPSGPLGNMN